MKSTNSQNKTDKFDMNVPQDMFGLGIQVFKIESKKQIIGNTKSVGKVRQEIKIIENPKKVVNVPPLPKPKKISAVLPSINKTPSEKQYKL